MMLARYLLGFQILIRRDYRADPPASEPARATPGLTALKTDSQKVSHMRSWHASQMPLPLPHPTDSGVEICDRAGVSRQPYSPLSQPRGSKHGSKLRGSITTAKDGQCRAGQQRGMRATASSAGDRVLIVPLAHRHGALAASQAPQQHEHLSAACLHPPSLHLDINRNQKPQRTTSSSRSSYRTGRKKAL